MQASRMLGNAIVVPHMHTCCFSNALACGCARSLPVVVNLMVCWWYILLLVGGGGLEQRTNMTAVPIIIIIII